ncbi:MAG: hypothetical protein ACOC56_03215 [Atribacterota bacterium]
MRTLLNIENIEKGNSSLIVGSGGTIREHSEKIRKYISNHNSKIIGINKMVSYFVPHYHLWTNWQRYRDLGSCVNKKSVMMFGCGLTKEKIRKHHKRGFVRVDYEKDLSLASDNIDYIKGKIYGRFRTAGVLSIMVAYIMGFKKIDIVGMDGYTLFSKKEIKKNNKNQHCYGSGFTDDASWEKCLEKDKMVLDDLTKIHKFGVKFRILTPTKFMKFYDGSVL